MFKKNWLGSWSIKSSKQVHSLDNLKTLHNVLFKNQTVTEQNKHLLVETLRSIAEILIWGDQNDSTVFDFFLEKNMLSFFLKIMKQKCGSYVCVQLLQTLNILFENIRDETSLYYLLSNNHVNSIIVHKFDFSDEEVMAYYISFLKTLSFKLNDHTIHFFFNEHTNDFPLYTEAIKFFNHNEKMVRIAVRTLTLNVFKVEEKSMLKFVGDHTAVPYFSNLVWFIGNHVLEIDNCLKRPIKDQQMLIKLDDLVAEHLDHLHYLNDILLLKINDLNEILTDHLLNRLLIPLYIYSLIASGENELNINQVQYSPTMLDQEDNLSMTNKDSSVNSLNQRPRISRIVSLFLLSQVFLIISYDSLVQQLVDIILNGNFKIFDKPQFIAPHETLEESLINNLLNRSSSNKIDEDDDCNHSVGEHSAAESTSMKLDENQNDELIEDQSCCDDSKMINLTNRSLIDDLNQEQSIFNENDQIKNLLMEEFFKDKPFLEALYKSFDCTNRQDDHLTIFSLSLLYAIIFNTGIKKNQLSMLNDAQLITDRLGSSKLIDYITQIINLSATFDSYIRPITLELCALLLMKLCIKEEQGNSLSDHHIALIEQTKENSTSVVRNYFRNENEQLFLDLFEDEYMECSKFKINVEYLMMDANLLLPPKQLVPLMLNNLHFTRRLPYSDIEKARYALRVFFIVRNLSMKIINETDDQLPLTNAKKLISIGDSIDLNNCNLVHCFLLQPKNQSKEEGYIVILDEQLVFIEPDNQRGIGSVSAKYTANLQNVDVCLDKDDSRSLLVTIRPNAANGSQTKFGAIDLNSYKTVASGSSTSLSFSNNKHSNTNVKLLFDDYIRCKVTEQHISRGKQNIIQRKLRKIANLIDIQLDNLSGQSSNGALNSQPTSSKHHRSHHLSSNSSRTLKYANNLSHHPQSGLPVPGCGVFANKIAPVFNKRLSNNRNRSLSSSNKNSISSSRESSKERSAKATDQSNIQQSSEMSPKNQRIKLSSERLTLRNVEADRSISVEFNNKIEIENQIENQIENEIKNQAENEQK